MNEFTQVGLVVNVTRNVFWTEHVFLTVRGDQDTQVGMVILVKAMDLADCVVASLLGIKSFQTNIRAHSYLVILT